MSKEERSRQDSILSEGTVFFTDGTEIWYRTFLVEPGPLEIIAPEPDYEVATLEYRVRQTSRIVVSNE